MRRIDAKDLLILKELKEGPRSIQELAETIGVRSTSTVHNRLEELEDRGLIIQPRKRQARSRQVTDAGIDVLKETYLA